jgi:hypothetical protein
LGALSSATQIAAENINVDGNVFAPVTRIQRWVLPKPPSPPATSHDQPDELEPPPGELGQIPLPNALLRCDGHGTNGNGFTVALPKIVGGFRFSALDQVPLYTGGQEIVVAEVAGGQKLEVEPSSGDTINGLSAAIKIKGHEARTFASDGLDNWIMIVGD